MIDPRGGDVEATFVHISDLHIGEFDQIGNAKTGKLEARLISSFPQLDGLVGHHAKALVELTTFMEDIKPAKGIFKLLVTGDLSRCGSVAELDLAKQFIFGSLDLHHPHEDMVGLNMPTDDVLIIPGNHDHWSGRRFPVGGSPSHFQTSYPNTLCSAMQSVTLPSGRVIEFYGINSDADVGVWSPDRFLAKGEFLSELKKLTSQLTTGTTANPVRILLCHHSFAYNKTTMSMNSASKAGLERLLADNGFCALLTGHTHNALLKQFTAQGTNTSGLLHEYRCGSTTQHDKAPYEWATLLKRSVRKTWPPNTLLVHRLLSKPGQTIWTTEIFELSQGRGFVSRGTVQATSASV